MACLRTIGLGFALIGLTLVGCGKSPQNRNPGPQTSAAITPSSDIPRPVQQDQMPPEAALVERESSLPLAGSDKSIVSLVTELKQAASSPQRFRPVGGSSVVLRVELTNGVEAAFKPTTTDRETAYQREIAAFRLASALGLDTVPPVILVKYKRSELQSKLERSYSGRWSEIQERILWDAQGFAEGALITWLSEAKSARLSDVGSEASWTQWLLQGQTAPSTSLARDLSNMLTFDYLIGNWDRFSGGNFKMTKDNSRLILLDHNSAFGVPLRDKIHERVYQRLRQAQKFSRTVHERLLALDEPQLTEIFKAEATAPALLSAAQVDGILDRRVTLLTYIQSLIEIHGTDKILVFE